MSNPTVAAERVAQAIRDSGMRQRALAATTGIPQSRISRIVSGKIAPSVPELAVIARATGTQASFLAGIDPVESRVTYAARATNGSASLRMRNRLTQFLALDAYLDDQGIPEQ